MATALKRHDSAEDLVERPRSFSDTSALEDTMESPHRRVSVPATHTPQAQSADYSQAVPPMSPGHTGTSEIARPRAIAKPSLLDAAPGQLLPPPSGKQAREGWTPTKPGHHMVKHPPAPLCPQLASPPLSPGSTPPSSPLTTVPASPPPSPPPHSEEAEDQEEPEHEVVTHRPSKRIGERPRSTGDVNKVVPKDEGATGTSNPEASEGKKEPPPPPPRKKGHSRSSSLDLNKLFAAKAKENLGKGLN